MLERVTAAVLVLLLLPVFVGRTAREPEFRRVVPDDPEIARILRALEDVPADAWYAPSLAYLCRRGAVEAEGCFCPNAPIGRADFAALLEEWAPVWPERGERSVLTWEECLSGLHRAAGAPDGGPEEWAEDCGLLEGLRWVPGEELTRAEAAVVAERFWRLREREQGVLPHRQNT